MKAELELSITRWIEANAHYIRVPNPVSDHVDYILGRELRRDEAVLVSIQAFEILVAEVLRLDLPGQPMLAIPLNSDSNVLSAAVPDSFPAILNQWRETEVPSLYLLDWTLAQYRPWPEEYRCPLPFDLPGLAVEGVDVYYTEFRDGLYIENNWEYRRCVNARYYPERYRR